MIRLQTGRSRFEPREGEDIFFSPKRLERLCDVTVSYYSVANGVLPGGKAA